MCGIAGTIAINAQARINPTHLDMMLPTLQHRGPDGQGIYLDPNLRVGLGHTRLSIVDLAGGVQPMTNEDGSIWVTFNGEIFNYVELRQELQAAGHIFKTQSDTEVIVHAYEQYGDAFVQHLNGQFAIGLWDARKQRTVLLRDQVGILPLFYTQTGDCLLFASEIKALLPCLDTTPQLSMRALDQIFTFWSAQAPLTIFENIAALPPGSMLIVENGKMHTAQYWDWQFPEDGAYRTESADALAEELHALLTDATRIRLRADVPVGAYLSGGLDSSALVALMHQQSPATLRTFSLGFTDPAFDETTHQQHMINELQLDHRRVQCDASHIADNFSATIHHTETAILRTAPTPMRLLSRLAHQSGCKVVLTGEGADEVFGGYDLFKEAKIRQFWARQPQSAARPQLLKRLYPYLASAGAVSQSYRAGFYGMGIDDPHQPGFSHLPRWSTTEQCKNFFAPHLTESLRGHDAVGTYLAALPIAFKNWHPFNRAQYLEAKTLMSNYLLCSQGDRMLMANSVEGRFPFLDRRIIAFANRLPPHLKMRGLDEKHLLKRAMQGRMPSSILARKKQPYRAPDMAAFVANGVPTYVEDMLSPTQIARGGYFDAKKVTMLLNKARRGALGSARDNMAFIGILSTQLCHHRFIETWAAQPLHTPIAQRQAIG
jgi:asparagine synthase (glutamine-hydrolysing)